MEHLFYIFDFIVFQILIILQIKASVKKHGFDTGTISIISSMIILEFFCIYNLIFGRSTLIVVAKFIWFFFTR